MYSKVPILQTFTLKISLLDKAQLMWFVLFKKSYKHWIVFISSDFERTIVNLSNIDLNSDIETDSF